MGLERLQQLAEDFGSLVPQELPQLIGECRELAVNRLDVRFMVVGECLQVTSDYWGPDEDSGAVTVAFAHELERVWGEYLPGILRADESHGVAVALALKDQLITLGALGRPLDYTAAAFDSDDDDAGPAFLRPL